MPAFPQVFFWLPAWQVFPAQHPAQVTPSHTQAPPTQCCPAAHAAPLPQRQAPAVEQPSAVSALHTAQAPPLAPQLPNSRGLHVVAAQQPPAQEVASQTQPPLRQRWPETQAEPPLHWQSPAGEQLSASAGSQVTQAAPAAPHFDSERIWQDPPKQQPDGHEVASHRHAALTQCCPVAQGGLLPHRQVPPGQLLARIASQGAQAAPAGAQAPALQAMQDTPEQQPEAQPDELHQPLHTPALQVPGVQPWQSPPPVPQAVSAPPERQVGPEQQPLHESASQTHALPEQRCPRPQGAALPQLQAPLAEQLSAF
jgi:hypothetical protein